MTVVNIMPPHRSAAGLARSGPISPRKPIHVEPIDEDTTTAYSSWHDDSSSQLSSCIASCLSSCRSRDALEADEAGDDDVESQISCHECLVSRSFEGRISARSVASVDEGDEQEDAGDDSVSIFRQLSLSSSSSYYSTRTDEPGVFSFELGPLQYSRSDHQFGKLDSRVTETTTSSCTVESDQLDELSDRAHHMLRREQSAESTGSGYSRPGARPDAASKRSIDATCRARMLEWSLKVMEFSFPYDANQTQHGTKRVRKYSTETLQAVSQAFLLIDRLASLHLQKHGKSMDRSGYKLTCMTCLHLVAKTSGLFSLYDSEREKAAEEEPSPVSVEQSSASPAALAHSHSHDTPCHEGRTIHSAPKHQPNSNRPRCSRPPLALLSLAGLVALCQNEYTAEQLAEAEVVVLDQLGWRITDPTSIDWCDLLLDVLSACTDAYGIDRASGIDVEALRENALSSLERAMEACSTRAPSLSAWAAVLDSFDEHVGHKHEHEALVSIYMSTVHDILPYAEEERELDRVPLSF